MTQGKDHVLPALGSTDVHKLTFSNTELVVHAEPSVTKINRSVCVSFDSIHSITARTLLAYPSTRADVSGVEFAVVGDGRRQNRGASL